MNKSSTYFLLVIGTILSTVSARADSPLTSTPFWQAYEDVKQVKYAKENGLDKKTLKWLTGKKLDCDVKLAMINSFGWSSEYTAKFENYLLEERKGLDREVFVYLKDDSEEMPEETEQTRLLTTDDLICWSYLRAMDNYQTPEYSIKGSFLAYWRDQKDMCAGVVWALLVGQMNMLGDWCKIYESAESFILNGEYERNIFREEAVVIMMEYLNLYEQDCQ